MLLPQWQGAERYSHVCITVGLPTQGMCQQQGARPAVRNTSELRWTHSIQQKGRFYFSSRNCTILSSGPLDSKDGSHLQTTSGETQVNRAHTCPWVWAGGGGLGGLLKQAQYVNKTFTLNKPKDCPWRKHLGTGNPRPAVVHPFSLR